MDQQTDSLLQMPTKTNLPKNSPVASSHHETVDQKKLVPFSTRVPAYVVESLENALELVTGAAMGRKVLTDWAEKRKR